MHATRSRPELSSGGSRLYSAVDRSNEIYEPSPHAPRRTIPSGEVSPGSSADV